MEKGCFVLSGIDRAGLLQAIEVAVEMREEGLCGITVPDYTDENVSSKVVGIVQSYVGIVDRFVWRKTDKYEVD